VMNPIGLQQQAGHTMTRSKHGKKRKAGLAQNDKL